ncbi:MAG: DapH/DapD/GlmU-related protein [Pseudomonadota bacterium]
MSTKKLGLEPLIDPTASVQNSTLGRYTEVAAHTALSEVEFGDYSYIMEHGSVWCAKVGKFANIASFVRINATNHPTWRATQHHFTYRAGDYFDGATHEEEFFGWRRENAVTIGHDVWVGHGATVLPGVTIGDGAVIGAGAVVSKDVAPFVVVGGVAAKPIRPRFDDRTVEGLMKLSWWDWSHDKLHTALPDFRSLSAADFVSKYL